VLSFVAQDQTNMSADSLGVAIDKPFREVLAPVVLYICVLDWLHFDLGVRRVFEKSGCRTREGVAAGMTM